MEATGLYYLDLAIELSAAGLPVSVINPKSSRNFARMKLQQSKTDEIDAQLLAEYGERMTPRLWTLPTAAQLELRAIGGTSIAWSGTAPNRKMSCTR
jgi:transposase